MDGGNQGPFSMSSAKSKEEQEVDFLRSLPSGFRFKPTDEELVEFYLKRKIQNRKLPPNGIRDVDLYNYDPETLTSMNNNGSSNGVVTEWYFFTPRERKYANGARPRRCAGNGFWKGSGKDKEVFFKGEKVGLKKTLVFYEGKPFQGDSFKTNWAMHEYVLIKAPTRQRLGKEDMRLDDWVLCRVYKKLNKNQKSSGKDATEGLVLENGNPPVAQKEEVGAGGSNMPMSNRTSLMPAYPIPGHGPGSLMPSSSVRPSNWSHLSSVQQQQVSNACPRNWSHLPLVQQHQPFGVMPEQKPAMFCNFMPTHVPLPPLPLNQQCWSKVLLQQQFSYVVPNNLPHLPPMEQSQQKQQFSHVGPSNLPHLRLPPMEQSQQKKQFSHVVPSNLQHLPPMEQSQQQQQVSHVHPSNLPQLPPKEQSQQQLQFSHDVPSNLPHLPPVEQSQQQPQVLHDVPSNLPPLPLTEQSQQQEEVSGDILSDFDLDDKIFEDFDLGAFSPVEL